MGIVKELMDKRGAETGGRPSLYMGELINGGCHTVLANLSMR